MKSILNEESFLSGIRKLFDPKNKKDDKYLGGSITRFTKNLVMSFPVLCDSSIPLETAVMISKSNERKMADLLQIMFSGMNIEYAKGSGKNAVDIIGDLYQNLDPNMDMNEFIDLLDTIAGGSPYKDAAKFEQAQIIREMIDEIKRAKPFPKDNFSAKSLNEYTVKQAYNQVIVGEVTGEERSPESDPYTGEKPGFKYTVIGKDAYNRDIYKYVDVYNTIGVGNDKEKYGNAINIQKAKDQNMQNAIKNDRDRQNDLIQRQKDMINMNQNRLSTNDVKKANEMQPTMISVNYNIVEKVSGINGSHTNVIDRKTFLAGIKSRLIPVNGIDIVERFAAKKRTELSLKNFIKATTGEISFVKDFLLCIDQAKLDAKNAAKRGPMSNVWHILEKRSAKNNLNKLKKRGNDATCITSVVLSQENVNYMKTAYRFDIEDINNAKMIMDNFNLLALFIADESTESVKVMYDGNSTFESLSFMSLDRELSDRNYRKMINLMNMQGR